MSFVSSSACRSSWQFVGQQRAHYLQSFTQLRLDSSYYRNTSVFGRVDITYIAFDIVLMSSYDNQLSDFVTTESSAKTGAVVGSLNSEDVEGSTSARSINSLPQLTSVKIDPHEGTELPPTGEELPNDSVQHNLEPPDSPMEVKVSNKKYISLIVLVVQNTALVLTMRYSRTVTSGPLYLASTAVVLTELVKFIICVSMIFRNNEFDPARTITVLKTEIIDKKTETLRLSVPSVLYTIQNNLLYIALTHLDAATFQVCLMMYNTVFLLICVSDVKQTQPKCPTVQSL